jgi:hypothetical protein
MAIPAQIVALYCLKFGLNAAIHTIFLLVLQIPIKDNLLLLDFSHGVRGKIKLLSLTSAYYLYTK